MRTLSLVAIWLSVAAASAAQRDKSSKADLSVSANTVLISAVVVDGAERAVRTLHREDFHLYESGREQKVTFFGQEELPVSSSSITAAA